jgi:hypothetical protein
MIRQTSSHRRSNEVDLRRMPLLGQIAGFFSVIMAIIVAVYKLTRTIERAQNQINSRLERLEMRIAVVENQNHAFLQVFPKVIMNLVREHVLTSETGFTFVMDILGPVSLVELFKDIKPTINPLSQSDLDTMRGYVERLRAGQWLSAFEAQDYYRISNIIATEYPANQNSWILFVLGGFILGAIVASSGKE